MMQLNKKKSFVVLLATCNGIRWLPEQIESILNQEDVEVTVIVSDDFSNDGTWEYLKKIESNYPCVKLLERNNKFGRAALNFFRLLKDVDLVSYDYVAFADQDDIWLPKKLITGHDVLTKSGADGYSSNVSAFWIDGRKLLIDKAQPQVKWDFLFEAAGPGCTYLLKAELAAEIQNFLRKNYIAVQEVGLHDWFFYAFARAKKYKWIIDRHPTMLYRQHATNEVGVNHGRKAFLKRAIKVRSGWGLTQSLLITHLIGVANDPFVKSWSKRNKLSLLRLAFNAGQCRRKMRDKFLFVLMCLILIAVGEYHK